MNPGHSTPRGLESLVTDAPMLNNAPTFRREWEKRERWVCCIDFGAKGGGGTGVLIGPDLILTNMHVLEPVIDESMHWRDVRVRFDHHGDSPQAALEVRLQGPVIYHRRFSDHDPGDDGGLPKPEELDYAIARLDQPVGKERGWLDLAEVASVPADDGFLIILQHPLQPSSGDIDPRAHQVAFANRGVIGWNENETRIRHRVNTLRGSSGSPCFDRHWRCVALHHAGDPAYAQLGHKRFNQAIPMERIVADMKQAGVYGEDERVTPTPEPPPIPGVHEARLIILTAEENQVRARLLETNARSSATLHAAIEQKPVVTPASNAVGVCFGGPGSAAHAPLVEDVRSLRNIDLQVIPVVEDRANFLTHAPTELHPFEAMIWPPQDGVVPADLLTRIRQVLGLEVDPRQRRVFLCYRHTDSAAQASALKEALQSLPPEQRYEVFLDVLDVQPGEPVQELIEQQFTDSGCHALLYIETEGAKDSKWIEQELRWAYTRGLAIVIVQRCEDDPDQIGRPALSLPDRQPMITCLPYTTIEASLLLADFATGIAKTLDRAIAASSTRNVQLARVLEKTARHAVGDASSTQGDVDRIGPNLMLATYRVALDDTTIEDRLLLYCTHHPPTAELLDHLRPVCEAHQPRGVFLLYDAPDKPVSDAALTGMRDRWKRKEPLFLYEREQADQRLKDRIRTLVAGAAS